LLPSPQGTPTTEKDLAACEATANGHAQFTFNRESGHCFVSDATTFDGKALDHVTSGCDSTKVATGCAAPKPKWTIVPGIDAVPKGTPTTEKDLAACEATANGHAQFTFNQQSGHCFVSDATSFGGKALDHVTSGCNPLIVLQGCHASAPTPAPPAFDGVVRNGTDGTAAAYLIPPFKSNHASTIEVLPDGTLCVAWFSGAHEEADKCAIVFAVLPFGSTQWSKAATLSQQEGYSNQNPVLFYDKAAKLLRLYHSHAPAQAGESKSVIFELSSADHGKTWTAPKKSPVANFPGAFPRNRIIPGLGGGLLFPIYDAGTDNSFNANFAIIERSTNDTARRTWSEHDIAGSANLVQPTVVRLQDKSLRMWFRDRKATSIFTATSTDDAKTWSKPVPAGLPNPNSGIEANILHNGHVVMVFNDYNSKNTSGYGRTPLNVALSLDGGKSWPFIRTLQETNDGQKAGSKVEFSYPSVLQTAWDGGIHATYTYDRDCIKYRRLTEAWITGKTD
jgi:predicted neuraminidase